MDNQQEKKEGISNEDFIRQEEAKRAAKEGKGKRSTLIIIVIVVVVIIGAVIYFMSDNDDSNDSNVIVPPINTDANVNAEDTNENINTAPAIDVNTELIFEGRVFVKGYDTPSESFGILTTTGNEIGFDDYDSMKETFRPYVNENINVTFENVCRSTTGECCRTLFFYCGTIKSWEPLEE